MPNKVDLISKNKQESIVNDPVNIKLIKNFRFDYKKKKKEFKINPTYDLWVELNKMTHVMKKIRNKSSIRLPLFCYITAKTRGIDRRHRLCASMFYKYVQSLLMSGMKSSSDK